MSRSSCILERELNAAIELNREYNRDHDVEILIWVRRKVRNPDQSTVAGSGTAIDTLIWGWITHGFGVPKPG